VKASLPTEALSGWVRVSPQIIDYTPLVLSWSLCRFVLAALFLGSCGTALTMLSLLMLWISSVWVRLAPQLLGLLM
jgi:hypothetical protein